MVIEVYSGFSKKPNSTKQPSGSGTSITCRLKDNCSVLNPVFLLHSYNLSHNYVKWGSRYYYIDDIVIVGNELAEYHCSTDVMATFKGDIIASTQFVARAAGSYNPYVVDSKYPVEAASYLSNLSLSSLRFTTQSSGTYVLGVISKASSGNNVSYYSMGASNFSLLMDKLFDDSYLTATDISTDLQRELVNPMQYIVSCYWYPFDVAGDATTVKFGWWDSGITAGLLSESQRIQSTEQTFSLPRHPQAATRGIYLNDAPFTRYTLNCYSFGSIPFDPAPFVTSGAGAIEIDVDIFTGVGTMYMAAQGSRLFQATAQVGVPIQINSADNSLVNGAVSALSGIASIATGHVVGGAAGIASAVTSMYPQVQSSGSTGSKCAFMQTPNINCEFRRLSEEDNAQIGRPLCAPRTISSLSGFIQCDNADLDTAASPSDKAQIIEYMNGGFYNE